ncbi:hypothetical protein OG226_42630 [Streptomyces sp. NBC_01261]|uniref:hypothetical protein n=1 Tax=Streptomyces sp. NBC_01261 TaxID=2903802 RepID=UPI002E30A5B4|nr:hypothetical protein [Streptomyces sp. NBC_01261]
MRPYRVIDDGWTEGGGSAPGGPLDTGLPGVFEDMAEMSARVAEIGARPGLWFRPLLPRTETGAVRPGMLRDSGLPLDPSLGVALDAVAEDVTRFRDLGCELIKRDRSRTGAEILVRLYRTIVEAAGDDAVVIGCDTVGHLAAGLTTVRRCDDDTSGRSWERTRRTGVNTLAFRLAQHNRLFTVDAGYVPCTPRTDWNLNRQFPDLVARSGAALFVSVDPAARTDRTARVGRRAGKTGWKR